jgi:hypothetical protein
MSSLTPSRIVLRHSNVSGEKPVADDLLQGEVYINIPDNKLYYRNRDDLVNPIVEIELTTTNDLLHVRDVDLTPDGDLIAAYSDNVKKPLGNVKGPAGRGLAIDGIVDYVNQLPTSLTTPRIANVLNKNGTLFIVRLGEDNLTDFDPTGPRIYSYSTSDGGTWSELEGATVAANGEDGVDGNTIISGVESTPNNDIGKDGDYYLDRINYVLFGPKSDNEWPETGVSLIGSGSIDDGSDITVDNLEINDSITFNNTSFNYGTGAAAAQRTALGLGTAAVAASTSFAASSHSHGNITFDGKIGTASGLVVTTGAGGVLTTSSRNSIDTRTSFPNSDVTAATQNETPNTIVKRNNTGGASFTSLNIEAGTLALNRQYSLNDEATDSTIIIDRESATAAQDANVTYNIKFPLTSGNVALYRLNTAPNQLTGDDDNKAMILQYGDSVWFRDDTNQNILLAGSGDEPIPQIITEVQLDSNESTVSFGIFPSAGQYRVRFDNFSSSNYDATGTNDLFSLSALNPPNGTFSDIVFGGGDGFYVTDDVVFSEDGTVIFYVDTDYTSWPSPSEYVEFLVTVDSSFDWQGYSTVKEFGSDMSVNLRVVITPESYTPPTNYTLTESITAGEDNAFTGVNSVTVPPGTYTVFISTSNFITTSWGSHNINLRDTPLNVSVFSAGDPGTLNSLAPDSTNENLSAYFAMSDPNIEPNQSGNITVTISSQTSFYLEGTLPGDVGASVDITVTFEQVL